MHIDSGSKVERVGGGKIRGYLNEEIISVRV
jgi:hypothetical protein